MPVGGALAGDRQPQRIAPAPRRMPLVARGTIGRAHGSARSLAAHTRPVTHLHRGLQALLAPVAEERLDRLHPHRAAGGTRAQRFSHGSRPHDVARVEAPLGIEDRLDRPQRVADDLAVEPLEQR